MQSAVSELRRFRTLQPFVPESFIASAQYASVNGFTFTFGGLDLHLVDWIYIWWTGFTSGGLELHLVDLDLHFSFFGVNYERRQTEV